MDKNRLDIRCATQEESPLLGIIIVALALLSFIVLLALTTIVVRVLLG